MKEFKKQDLIENVGIALANFDIIEYDDIIKFSDDILFEAKQTFQDAKDFCSFITQNYDIKLKYYNQAEAEKQNYIEETLDAGMYQLYGLPKSEFFMIRFNDDTKVDSFQNTWRLYDGFDLQILDEWRDFQPATFYDKEKLLDAKSKNIEIITIDLKEE